MRASGFSFRSTFVNPSNSLVARVFKEERFLDCSLTKWALSSLLKPVVQCFGLEELKIKRT
jgi:hypothetical protein